MLSIGVLTHDIVIMRNDILLGEGMKTALKHSITVYRTRKLMAVV